MAELGITIPDATDASVEDMNRILKRLNDIEEDNDA
jgi:hypothetical protein